MCMRPWVQGSSPCSSSQELGGGGRGIRSSHSSLASWWDPVLKKSWCRLWLGTYKHFSCWRALYINSLYPVSHLVGPSYLRKEIPFLCFRASDKIWEFRAGLTVKLFVFEFRLWVLVWGHSLCEGQTGPQRRCLPAFTNLLALTASTLVILSMWPRAEPLCLGKNQLKTA